MRSYNSPLIIITLSYLLIAAAAQAMPPLTSNLEWKGRIVVEFAQELGSIQVDSESDIALIGEAGLDALARQYDVYGMEKLIPWSTKPDDPSIPDISRYYILEFPEEIELHEVVDAYATNPNIITAEPYLVRRYCYTPNDSLFSQQWALQYIGAEIAYDYCQGRDDVIFGLVDTGIDTAHEDLRDNLWINPGEDLNGNGIIDPEEWNGIDDEGNGFIDDFWGWNLYLGNNIVQDSCGHGTHLAGDASAFTDNEVGIASLGWSARIMTTVVGDGVYVYAGIQGIAYCADNGANVINISWGGPTSSSYEQSLINLYWSQGVIFIAAAGNDHSAGPHYPSGYDHVLSVGSVDGSNHLSSFTNFGDGVDVYAPGSYILSTFPGNAYVCLSGSSVGSAITCGLACLVWAAAPDFTNEEVVQQIITTCAIIDSLNPGYPGPILRIDAGAALAGIFLDITLTPENPPIVIPASGGSFDYSITLSNADSIQHTFDCWCDITLPDGSHFGPVLEPRSIIVPGNTSTNQEQSQRVPEYAPPGNYRLNAYIGNYPYSICDRDTIYFQKLESGPGVSEYAEDLPSRFALIDVHPNPFNSVTTISFELPKAGFVKLEVFDINGRRVGAGFKPAPTPGSWYPPGIHQITFDGTGLASGIYIYHMQAGQFSISGKMLLLK